MISQIAIVVLGGSAIWVVGRKEQWSRWGYVLGLLSQPFWVISAVESRSWGILLISLWYTYAWSQGIWNHFEKEEQK